MSRTIRNREPYMESLRGDSMGRAMAFREIGEHLERQQRVHAIVTYPVYLNVPKTDYSLAAEAGAKWDKTRKQQYVPAHRSLRPFKQWLRPQDQHLVVEN